MLQQYPLLTHTEAREKAMKAIEKLDKIAGLDEQSFQSFCVSQASPFDVAVRHRPEIIRHDERKLDKNSQK